MVLRLEVKEYVRADGSCPYADWFNSLDAQAAAKVATAKLRMELGNTSSVKWFAGIGEYIFDRAMALYAEYKRRNKYTPCR